MRHVVELYLPQAQYGSTTARVRDACAEPVTLVDAVFVPADEMCVLMFDAPDAPSIAATLTRAGVTYDRLLRAV